ncbi:MAG TPA: hypothetical protein VEJ18_14005 [Planctomycetota bacterium]|nr:hypothetical protein [Planctomycetota bacterium]
MKWTAAILLLAAQDPGRPPRDPFAETFALVKASPGEARWDEIEWTTSLWEGRKRAAAEGKPLFIWAANGNPLGLT